jgi:hypothetical protein
MNLKSDEKIWIKKNRIPLSESPICILIAILSFYETHRSTLEF